jgi:hypothetical protein
MAEIWFSLQALHQLSRARLHFLNPLRSIIHTQYRVLPGATAGVLGVIRAAADEMEVPPIIVARIVVEMIDHEGCGSSFLATNVTTLPIP